MTELRRIDCTQAPEDLSAPADRAESVFTHTGSGTTSTVSGVGLRASVGATSGDAALVQTPEAPKGQNWVECRLTALLGGTQVGRQVDLGFLDTDTGAFIRIADGVVSMRVRRDATVELVAVASRVIDLSRVHTYSVRITERHEVEFFVDGESLGSMLATTDVLTDLLDMRAGFRISNPLAATGSANVDIHRWTVDADRLPTARRVGNVVAAEQLVLKAAPGVLHELHVTAEATSARYVMLFDKASAPINTDVPVRTGYIAAGARVGEPILGGAPMRFAKGISVALSTTPAALTLPSGEGYFDGAVS